MRSFLIRLVQGRPVPAGRPGRPREIANPYFESATDIASVLWQNGLLGYLDERGARRFYSLGDIEEFSLPPEVDNYVIHPCLARSVGLTSVRSTTEPARSEERRPSGTEFGAGPSSPGTSFTELFGDGIFRPGRYLFRGSADAD